MKKLNKKLVLNKERIASLNNEQQSFIWGGDQQPSLTYTCQTYCEQAGCNNTIARTCSCPNTDLFATCTCPVLMSQNNSDCCMVDIETLRCPTILCL